MTVTLGLISDTHMPDRWKTLPQAVFDIFDGVDLILHAGDVGELWVLDQLGAVAPVAAVHGNDEFADAPDHLPFEQVLFAADRRILLTHGHHPDHDAEMAFRRQGMWPPKLAWLAGRAQQAGASIMIYGHTHVPWMIEFDGVWLVNPGGIAAGGHLMRQTVQTVARLTLAPGRDPEIEYLDANNPARPVTVTVDPAAHFVAAQRQICESIATPELDAHRDWLFDEIYPLAPGPLLSALRRVMYRCLEGELARMDTGDLLAEALTAPDIPEPVKQALRAHWDSSTSALRT